ncbi:MAG: hypothetical protein ABSA97_11450 [Verrucomicrobiia bacterium]|jgi:hypothetical protein
MKNKLALLAIAIGAVVLVSGCDQRRETTPPPAPQAQAPAPATVAVAVPYYYYPDVEVYYHPETKVYWWHGDGAWVSGPRPPSTIVLRDDARVTVNLNVSEPWRQHETVLKQHPHGGRK